MKTLALVLLIALLASPVEAQIITVTASGTLEAVNGTFDNTVALGTPFTDTFTINSQATGGQSATVGGYFDPAGTATFTFGDYAYGSTGVSVQIDHGYLVAPFPTPNFGFLLGSGSNNLDLVGTNPAINSDTTLNIPQDPVSDFLTPSADLLVSFSPNVQVEGEVTSYSVIESAPEPSTYILMILGSLLLGIKLKRKKLAGN